MERFDFDNRAFVGRLVTTQTRSPTQSQYWTFTGSARFLGSGFGCSRLVRRCGVGAAFGGEIRTGTRLANREPRDPGQRNRHCPFRRVVVSRVVGFKRSSSATNENVGSATRLPGSRCTRPLIRFGGDDGGAAVRDADRRDMACSEWRSRCATWRRCSDATATTWVFVTASRWKARHDLEARRGGARRDSGRCPLRHVFPDNYPGSIGFSEPLQHARSAGRPRG